MLEGAGPEASRAIGLHDRCLQAAVEIGDIQTWLKVVLPDLVTEFSAQWVGILQRSPEWTLLAEHGQQRFDGWPVDLLEEALDRGAAGSVSLPDPDDWTAAAVPLSEDAQEAAVLLLAGGNLDPEQVPAIAAAGRAVSATLKIVTRTARDTAKLQRLSRTLDASIHFASVTEVQPLLELIAAEATRLLDSDRASIFVHDPERNELVACPALGVEGGTLRLPDNVGIVGDVVQTGQPVHVNDAYNDARFNPAVDKESGYRTRNLLCVPLRDTRDAVIGAFELINRNEGDFDDDDLDGLEHLARQAAVALTNTRQHEQLLRSREQLAEQVTRGVQIIGQSASIVALRDTIDRLAGTDLPVLVLGPSGTGKEVVSQALHYQGSRADHPFVAVNCAALSESLLESELFGHEKGAFTDAVDTRQGKFELADSGTLFLDEIGDMSPGGQAKLLRVLEQKVVTRVGGSQTIPVNVRVIAATNQDLTEAVQEKRFREDLFYRLSVVTLELPALAERPEDILPLAEYFLRQFCAEANRNMLELAPESRQRLETHTWPGNVRELRNLMERVAFLCPADRIEIDDLAFILAPGREPAIELPTNAGLAEATRRFQQDYIRRSIRLAGDNMSEAAKRLGLHRSNLYRKMRQLEMGEGNEEDF